MSVGDPRRASSLWSVPILVILFAIVVVSAVILSRTAARVIDPAIPPAAVERDGSSVFVEIWSTRLGSPAVQELAAVPGRAGEFFALQNDVIHRFDSQGGRQGHFAGPDKSSRMATDPTGAIPYLLTTSRTTKWTGAIDYVETTGYFLHALTTQGQVVWSKRFDPKTFSVLEPIVTRLGGTPTIVLSASKQIVAVDLNGMTRWTLGLWHHPGTLTVADFNGDGNGHLLVAQAPSREIVRIDVNGQLAGAWGRGDGPSRLRAVSSAAGFSAVSLRQVFGRGPGVRHALRFFDATGTSIADAELPPDASTLSFAPLTAMNIDGRGEKVWVIVLGDGSVRVYSPSGRLLATDFLPNRPRTYAAVPQPSGPDHLVIATDRGLQGLRPVAARLSVR